jgi:2-methylcitrate dehydratase
MGVELAQRLASYALSARYRDLDARTVKEMKARIVDAFGCAIGAYREEAVAIARRAVGNLRGRGASTLLGTGSKTSPELATFVNGLMIRYFDFNDTYLSKEPAHPSDNLAPCFAVAESEGAPGRELIAVAVAAYEIQCRLCDAADIRHRGWDHVNYGLVSSTLAASTLMKLDERRATQAVNIALNGHIAMRQVRAGELSMWKGASFSNAARNGVFAALLAKEGMTGPAPIFEGEMGFFRQVSGKFSLDTGRFGGRGGGYKVNETYIKYWPAEYHAQSAIWAALEARRHVKDMGKVRSILVETHEAGYTILGKDREKWRPKTKETADHSLPYLVGMAMLHGTVDNHTYSGRNLKDAKNIEFVRRVRVVEDPRFTALYPKKGMANRVTVREDDGRETAAEIIVPKGHRLNPMTKVDIEAKFLRLTAHFLGQRGAKEALSRLWALEKEQDLGQVLSLLRAEKGLKA